MQLLYIALAMFPTRKLVTTVFLQLAMMFLTTVSLV